MLVELLAPAGNFESLRAAVNAGADSVYFGIADFNMRASAARNFKMEDLPEIVKICKKGADRNGNGKKPVRTYVTVNTLIYNDEIEKMHSIVDAVKANGIDAIIAADLATIVYARKQDVEVHASTQLSISNTETVKFYAQYCDRIVLARELTTEQIRQICDDIKEQKICGPKGNLIEIEVFAHGALCVSVSGRCAMSLFCYGPNFSASRGKCTQICRRRYKVTDIETKQELEIDNNYVMSPKDLCTIGLLPEIINAGVTVLKLEGRGRSPEYVDTVVSCYREALESIADGSFSEAKVKEWNVRLGTVYNKGFSTGFYMGRKFDEWSGIHGSKATKEKIKVGVVRKYYSKISVVEVLITAKENVNPGDEYSVNGPTTGVVTGKIQSMEVFDKDGLPITSAQKVSHIASQDNIITFKVETKVRPKDILYILRTR